MAQIEKTVFISYRRSDVYTALAVYQDLKNQGYDVFFDYRSISSGDFEQIITSNIRARAHFLLILTPTALDRINEPGDWLRREIETAIDEKRNIVPLFFRGFRFGVSPKSGMSRLLRLEKPEVLTGQLKDLSRYNGLNVHEDYFDEAMHRLRSEYLNKPLDTVLHPISNTVQRIVRAEQIAADQALDQIEDVKELVKQAGEEPEQKRELPKPLTTQVGEGDAERRPRIAAQKPPEKKYAPKTITPKFNPRFFGSIAVAILVTIFVFWVGANLLDNLRAANSSATPTLPSSSTNTFLTTITLPPTELLPSTPSEPFSYTIKEGDTLFSIAQEFNLGEDGVALIIDQNPSIINEFGGVLFVGQVILIPPPGTIHPTATPIPASIPRGTLVEYRVLPDDTLAKIAPKFNSLENDIIDENNIQDANALQVGQVLQIPVNLVTPAPTVPPTSTPRIPTVSSGQATSTLGIGSMQTGKDGMTLLYVPAGEFRMGSDCCNSTDALPVHSVYLDGYWIDKTEVTVGMYRLCVGANICLEPASKTSNQRASYYGVGYFDNYPVIYVDWNMAHDYCSWVNRRLPTEAEWEKAARGNDERIYPWGNDAPNGNLLNYNRPGGDTRPVGTHPTGASPYGLLDIAGNVSEWVADWRDENYYSTLRENSINPQGPLEGQFHVVRGGSWYLIEKYARTTFRSGGDPASATNDIGFRCATSATP